ncbi:MAG TPA: rod shape-determining protein MreC [Candidatus Baltobacteraceae bacterium]|nr:rod shape-determining protein MreC [Candidatus Baltobacteraceae bacterium]
MLWRLIAKHRRAVILGATLIASFLLMTLQVRHDPAVVAFTRQAVLMAVSPVIKVTAVALGSVGQVWQDYIDLRTVRKENLQLRREAAIRERRVSQLEEQALETQRLQGLLAIRDASRADFLAARVVGRDTSNWFKTILIDRGSSAGIRRNLPVIAPDGLVGRVFEVTPTLSKVQLLTDPVSAAGGLVQRTRVAGIVFGNLEAGLVVRYLPQLADVAVGDEMITSGLGGVFPKGIPVGRVVAVERRSGALFQEATLQPKVDLSRLEEVLILLQPDAPAGVEAGGLRQK